MWLLLLFVVLPAAELSLLIKVGSKIGAGNTLLAILATGLLGAWLARSQGLAILAALNARMARGEPPTRELLEGALVLVAGAVLLTPGFLTDAIGLLCLLPVTRRGMLVLLERAVARGRLRAASRPPGARGGGVHFTWMSRDAGGQWHGGTTDGDGSARGADGPELLGRSAEKPRGLPDRVGGTPVKDVEIEDPAVRDVD